MNEEITYRVFELNQKIKEVLESSFPRTIWIKGEIADFDRHASQKNIFFQLQEKDQARNRLLATVDCLLQEYTKPRLRDQLIRGHVAQQIKKGMDGLEVRLKVRISVYVPSGKYSLIVEDIDPEFTLGKLEQNRKAIIDYLTKNNLLDKNKTQTTLPIVIQKIGLITKEGSQAYFDFSKKLEASHFSFSVLLYQSTMQGKQVESGILKALEYFHSHQEDVDVVVIIRGGGSRSDLSWFDNQKIATAIANFPKPILTGIGHKTDISVADLVAYKSIPTPNAVADEIIGRNEDYFQEIQKTIHEINTTLEHFIHFQQQSIRDLQESIIDSIHQNHQKAHQSLLTIREEIIHSSYSFLKLQKQILFEKHRVIISSIKNTIQATQEKLRNYQSEITILDPINVMKRGFSLTTVNGKIIKDIKGLKVGQEMWTYLAQGQIKSYIQDVKKRKS